MATEVVMEIILLVQPSRSTDIRFILFVDYDKRLDKANNVMLCQK